MSEHLTDSTLGRFREGRLGSGLGSADQHLAGCPTCRDRLRRLAPVSDSGLLASVRSEARRHLDYDQIEGLHEGTLPGEEAAAARDHIAICKSCKEESNDFSAFADELATPVTRTAQTGAQDGTPAFFDRMWGRLRRPNLAVAGAALVAVLSVWVGTRVVMDPASGARVDLALVTVNDGTFTPDWAFRITATLEERAPRGSTRPASLADVTPGPVAGLVYPVGEAVSTVNPVLQWSGENGPPYRVEVFDTEGALVIGSETLEDVVWEVTPGLEPDRIYSWHVIRGVGPGGMADFRTLSLEEASLWAGALANYADQPLLLGAIAQDLGLIPEARSFYGEEIQEDPDSGLATRLLERLESE